MAEVKFTPAQEAAIRHRDAPLLVSAGAGSGKTKVLVERLMDLCLRDGADLDRFLIITYTRAAAAELRGRIQKALSDRLALDPRNPRLRRQLVRVPHAQIGTIHSFCSAVLREYAAAAGLRPDFRQIEGAEETALREAAVQETLLAHYGQLTEAFRQLADTLGAGRDDRKLADLILSVYESIQGHPDPAAWLRQQIALPVPAGDLGDTEWGRQLIGQAAAAAAFWRQRLRETAEELRDNSLLAGHLKSFTEAERAFADFEAVLGRGWDAARENPLRFPTRLQSASGSSSLPEAVRAKAVWGLCKSAAAKINGTFAVSSEEELEDVAAVRTVTDELLRLVLDFSDAYAAEKQRRGVLDFGDLEHLALHLLTEADGETPSVAARELAGRYTEILVDEYQDCNAVQDRIFRAISRDGRNLTMVGDVRQSIYRFRLADPSIFLARYRSYSEGEGGEGRRLILAENFRSDPGLLERVNEVFRNILSQELGEMRYGDAECLKPGGSGESDPEAFRLFVPEYGEQDRIPAEAEAVADYLQGLLSGPMTVPTEEGTRPLRPGDIAILLRSIGDRDAVYADALRRRGIPAVCLKSSRSLRDRPEVNWAFSLLETLDNPLRDIPLLAALRSPVWGVPEERLAVMRCAGRSGCLYDALCAAAETEADFAAVLAQLRAWRGLARELNADRLLGELYRQTNLPALAEAREPGSSANLDLLRETARGMENSSAPGISAFIERFRAMEGGNRLPAAESGAEGVIITTIHGSKGLEYPVTVLADCAHAFNLRDTTAPLLLHPELGAAACRTDFSRGIRWQTALQQACAERIRRESLSEEMRVLYVGMTRAKQRLAVFVSVEDREKVRTKLLPQLTAPLAPEFLKNRRNPGEWLLAVSLIMGARGPWEWRDVPKPAGPFRPDSAVPAEAGPDGLPDPGRLREILNWRYAREADTHLPGKITATGLRVTAAAAETAEAAETPEPAAAAAEAFVFRKPRFLEGSRPLSASERGTAVHLAMQYLDWDRCGSVSEAAEAIRTLAVRRLLTAEQAEAVDPALPVRFLQSPAGRLLRRGTLHREFKFSLLMPAAALRGEGSGEVLLQGVADCWSELPEGIVLLDYKTDRVTRADQTERAALYAPQLAAYAMALERITGRPVLHRLVYFFATGDTVELTPEKPAVVGEEIL